MHQNRRSSRHLKAPKSANRSTSESKKNERTLLLTQIVLRVSIPLAILSAVFIGFFLKIQIEALNQHRSVETELIIERVTNDLENQLQTSGHIDEGKFKQALTHFDHQNLLSVNVMDFRNKKLLWPERLFPWSNEDTSSSAKSLGSKIQGKHFYGRVDFSNSRLAFYIPLQNQDPNEIYIARALLSLNNIQDTLKKSRNILFVIIILILITGVFIGKSLSSLIVKPIKILEDAAENIIQGHLGDHIHIHSGNEFDSLAETFNHMSDRIREIQNQAADSNPLTGLPGNQGIFEELKKRIHERQKFVLFHTDLNRFKVFNDHYGLAHGDKAIILTADVLRRAAKEKGSRDTFVGHQGGDDFVIITHPSHGTSLGEFICQTFDREVVPTLYPKEDFEKGYVTKIDRRRLAETGEERVIKFPLLSIAVAGVSNVTRDFSDYYDCMEKVVKAKELAKQSIQSTFLIKE